MNLLEEIEKAKSHYRDRNFQGAMEAFERIIDIDRDQWECHLYLAMCSYKLGQVHTSMQRFRSIIERCPIKDVRDKAQVAMGPIQQEARSMTMSDLKKPDVSKLSPTKTSQSSGAEDDSADMEWMPKKTTNQYR